MYDVETNHFGVVWFYLLLFDFELTTGKVWHRGWSHDVAASSLKKFA
jgi:hypothetical protein